MYQQRLAAPLVLLALCASQSLAQTSPKPADPPRAAAPFDVASIRRQATQMAEFRALLSDPDSAVRLLAMREAIRAGDATQRQLAIDAGLASNESSMVEQALRGIMVNTRQIVVEFVDADGKPLATAGGFSSIAIPVGQFNPETGQMEGIGACARKWSGQLQGTVFSFNNEDHACSGSLSWTAETGDFRGHVNIDQGRTDANRNAVWKPR